MSFRRSSLAAVHQSDSLCLRRLKFESDFPQPSGHFAVVGILCHTIIETYTVESARHDSVDPRSVIRQVVKLRERDPEVTPFVVEDVVKIMAGAFGPRSELNFKLPPPPLTVAAEWRWALREDLTPIAPCDGCAGTGVMTDDDYDSVTCYDCCGSGWSEEPAHEGTIDRLVIDPVGGSLSIYDWKSTIVRESNLDVAGDKQGMRYATAVLAHFPKARKVRFYKTFLRHGYSAWADFERDGAWHEAHTARMRTTRTKRLAAIQTGVWNESLGESCSYCPLIETKCGEQLRVRATGIAPTAPIDVQANEFLGVRAWMKVAEARLKAHVQATQAPIDLKNEDGEVLGMKPVGAKRMVISYEEAMARLDRATESGQMSDEFRTEYFRFVGRADIAGRVLKAAGKILGGRAARDLLFAEFDPWLEEDTAFEFGVHAPLPGPPARREMSDAEFDELLDRIGS